MPEGRGQRDRRGHEARAALTTGQMNNRTIYGAIPLGDAEITRMATSGARAFLRAYRPR